MACKSNTWQQCKSSCRPAIASDPRRRHLPGPRSDKMVAQNQPAIVLEYLLVDAH
jgi:hypothetical protein